MDRENENEELITMDGLHDVSGTVNNTDRGEATSDLTNEIPTETEHETPTTDNPQGNNSRH
jgi:hypothetical protein